MNIIIANFENHELVTLNRLRHLRTWNNREPTISLLKIADVDLLLINIEQCLSHQFFKIDKVAVF